jgi:hypothetical protein
MTPRQRIMKILNGEKPDRVPWFGDLDYWATALICRGEKPKDFKFSNDYIKWHRDLGVGYYLQGFMLFKIIIEKCEIHEYNNGHFRIRQIQTPKGTLQEKWQWIPDSFAQGPVEHLVKSADDLPAYQFMYDNIRYEPDNSYADLRLKQVGEAGFLMGYLPKSPLMQMIALDAGIETFMKIFMDAPTDLEETIKAIRRSHDIAAQIMVDSPADVLMIPENLSAEVVGPTLFNLYMKEYQQNWASQIKKTGKYSCIHMDGTLKGLLKEECGTGLTFIEAMTPGPVGDLDIEEWADFCDNDKTILWGGIPGVYFTPLVSDEEFETHVKRVLKVMTTSPRYVLGIADQAPPDTLEYRVRQVRTLVEEYGVYA